MDRGNLDPARVAVVTLAVAASVWLMTVFVVGWSMGTTPNRKAGTVTPR